MITAFVGAFTMVLAAGPSFDCAKATTPTEKAICKDPELSRLDVVLAREYAAALERRPSERQSLVEAQAAWLDWRNRGLRGQWLPVGYRDRIVELQDQPDRAALPLCRSFIKHYREAVERSPATGQPVPVPEVFAQEGQFGVKFGGAVAQPTDASPAALAAWGAALSPSLTMELVPFKEPSPYGVTIAQVPGQRWFAVSHQIGGTANCHEYYYFKDEAGRATPVRGPPYWTRDVPYSGCQVTRTFGTVDGIPVALEFGGDPEQLTASVHLSRWTGDGFGPPCHMTFKYSLQYSAPKDKGVTPFDEACGANGCEGFRDAARDAVLAVRNAAQVTENNPVRTRKAIDGVAYRILAGRVAVGWRVFSSWRVKFVRETDGAEVASLVVESDRGALKSAVAW